MVLMFFFFFKQKTAYEMRISDWSSDVCSSDLLCATRVFGVRPIALGRHRSVCRGFCVSDLGGTQTDRGASSPPQPRPRRNTGGDIRLGGEIGRASCRERVCQYV